MDDYRDVADQYRMTLEKIILDNGLTSLVSGEWLLPRNKRRPTNRKSERFGGEKDDLHLPNSPL